MYNDEQILSINEYEAMAKAYAQILRDKGFRIVCSATPSAQLVDSIFLHLAKIKCHLFALGGFLGTSPLYSLNERQLNKLCVVFDREKPPIEKASTADKTKNFLSYLSNEFALLQELLTVAEQTSFEQEVKNILNQRLSLLSKTLSL